MINDCIIASTRVATHQLTTPMPHALAFKLLFSRPVPFMKSKQLALDSPDNHTHHSPMLQGDSNGFTNSLCQT